MSAPILELDGYGLAFGERIVLAGVRLLIAPRGLVVLVGPTKAGKSSLLRTLAGANEGNPALRTWGRASYAGRPLGEGPQPALVSQNAKLLIGTLLENLMSSFPGRSSLTQREQAEIARRLLTDAGLGELGESLRERVIDLPLGLQRRVAVVRTGAAEPGLLCVDEPTADLSDDEAGKMIALLRREAERRAVLLVTHNQRHARAAGGSTALLAGGEVHEHRSTEAFFTAPETRAAQHFVRTGSSDLPSPGARPEELEEGVVPTPLPTEARAAVSELRGPRGFRWARRGQLGGTPRPGIVEEIAHDLAALKRVGVTVLVTLEEERLPLESLAPFGLQGLFFPVVDMRAPSVDAALLHCARVARLLAAGEVVALHCRAGLGRTGTMLAAQLVHDGRSALEALDHVRRIEPGWVQSSEQVTFLERFAETVRTLAGRAPELSRGPPS